MTATAAAIPRKSAEPRFHISASQLRTFAACPLQWRYSRIYTPEFVGSTLVFGRAFHAALETYYQAQLEGRIVGRPELLETFERSWSEEGLPIRYGKRDDEQSLKQTAARMIDAFLADVEDSRVVAIEERFECPMGPDMPPLVGYIDLAEIGKDEDGRERLHLVDFKTAARKPSAPDDMDPDQLTLYGIAAHRVGLLRGVDLPLVLEYRVVTKAKTPQVVDLPVEPTRRDARRLLNKARVICRAMESGLCYPAPGWQCANCGFQSTCRNWPAEPKGLKRKEETWRDGNATPATSASSPSR